MQHNWQEIARARWTHCPVEGDGRFAIAVLGINSGRTQRVILVADEATQKSASLFYEKVQRVDLLELIPSPPSKACRIIADAYDPEEHRRERRERNA